MSYNGTVQCRECYETGHNKRTCPSYTERLKNMAQRELDNGDGMEGYWGRQFAKRTGKFVDGTSAAEHKAGRRDAGQKRRCTYCGLQAHNRRSCDTLKNDVVDWAHKRTQFRQKIHADMKERGLGIGCLVLAERWNDKYLMLVDKIVWDRVDQSMGNNDVFEGSLCGKPNRRWQTGYPEGDFNSNSYHKVAVVGPVAPDAVVIPDNFFCLDQGMKDGKLLFKERNSEHFHENQYKYEG